MIQRAVWCETKEEQREKGDSFDSKDWRADKERYELIINSAVFYRCKEN